MKYGILDTIDNLWLGTEEGPELYEEQWLAKIAAMIAAKRTNVSLTRYRAMPFDESQSVRLKDEISTDKDSLTALIELEEGR
jgi:hypothetical protein